MNFIDLKTQYSQIKLSVDANIQAVLEHGKYIMGPEVAEVEIELSNFSGARHCITVASGTEALLISLMAIGVKPGDEVITTPFTFIASVEVIVLLGAIPVFVDIEVDTANIDAKKIEAKVTNKTKAIMPVSLYGQPADMDEINDIGAKYGVFVIEDAAQSFGATYKDKKSCNLSHIGCTSFFPSKPLGCYGDGGAIFTSDDELAQVMKEIRVHGQPERYVHTRIGVGGRMDTIQCAVILAKLENFKSEVENRLRIGARYNQKFAGKIKTITQREDRNSMFAQYTILVENRDKVRAKLNALGIPTSVHYPIPCNKQPAYKQFSMGNDSPIADKVAKQVMSLPMHPFLTNEDMERIVEAVLGVAQ